MIGYDMLSVYWIGLCIWYNLIYVWYACNILSVIDTLSDLIVEQIIAYVRGIVQIMIQATDLAQILYRVTLQEKNAGHAKFQYGRHFPRWPPRAIPKPIFFALKGQQMVEKGNFDHNF